MKTWNEIVDIVLNCAFEPWQINLHLDNNGPYLQVADVNGKCNVTGKPASWRGRKWRMSYYMTETEIVNTAWMAVHTALTHEALENFKYRGITIFNPHISVEARLYAAQHFPLDSRD